MPLAPLDAKLTGQSFGLTNYDNLKANIDAIAPVGKITISAWAGGPPVGPADGDLWIATGVDGNGTRWGFQYDASEPGTYKWKKVWGPPARTYIATAVTNATNSPANSACVATLGRGGDYQVEYDSDADTTAVTAGSYGYVSASVSASSGAWQENNAAYAPVAFNGVGLSNHVRYTNRLAGASAGATVTAQIAVNNNGISFTGRTQNHRLIVDPIRII